ncbi:hypothetical protein Q5752_001410 [Cryptotrichosporon argae]
MLHPLAAPPAFISIDEHERLTSSTPASFSDIPPVLRWTDAVRVTVDGAAAEGTLWVTEAAVAFLRRTEGNGWALPFPALTLHAHVPASAELPAHIYCQVDDSDAGADGAAAAAAAGEAGTAADGANGHGAVDANGTVEAEGQDEDAEAGDDDGGAYFEEDYTAMREVRVFVPADKLDPLFAALSACSALHVTAADNLFGFGAEDDGDDDDDGAWDDADEGGDGDVAGGRAEPPSLSNAVAQHDLAGFDFGQGSVDVDPDALAGFLGKLSWAIEPPAGWAAEKDGEDDGEEGMRTRTN